MVLKNLYSFIEEQVDMVSPEEKVARNNIIIAEVSLEQVKERLETRHTMSNLNLGHLGLEKLFMTSTLRS
jgi:hypothetical protein